MNSEMDLNGFPMDFEWVWAPLCFFIGFSSILLLRSHLSSIRAPFVFLLGTSRLVLRPPCFLMGRRSCFYWVPIRFPTHVFAFSIILCVCWWFCSVVFSFLFISLRCSIVFRCPPSFSYWAPLCFLLVPSFILHRTLKCGPPARTIFLFPATFGMLFKPSGSLSSLREII